ncbi:hypothetical protein CY0110_19562 [Crocosphaera chwakensis CCY0110]|uniref:Uncharacterized protein n=1 Tax=Crocosphaera chwakensis CCY0110 TaxID=391612 RepID=A3IJP4_9CHRO|nr:hypothetical protein CY0110_19562 [Crocosphaera chwakensis CCY0110]
MLKFSYYSNYYLNEFIISLHKFI